MQQVVAQIPWGHNIVLLDKIADSNEREMIWLTSATKSVFWCVNCLAARLYCNSLYAIISLTIFVSMLTLS